MPLAWQLHHLQLLWVQDGLSTLNSGGLTWGREEGTVAFSIAPWAHNSGFNNIFVNSVIDPSPSFTLHFLTTGSLCIQHQTTGKQGPSFQNYATPNSSHHWRVVCTVHKQSRATNLSAKIGSVANMHQRQFKNSYLQQEEPLLGSLYNWRFEIIDSACTHTKVQITHSNQYPPHFTTTHLTRHHTRVLINYITVTQLLTGLTGLHQQPQHLAWN